MQDYFQDEHFQNADGNLLEDHQPVRHPKSVFCQTFGKIRQVFFSAQNCQRKFALSKLTNA